LHKQLLQNCRNVGKFQR